MDIHRLVQMDGYSIGLGSTNCGKSAYVVLGAKELKRVLDKTYSLIPA
jgi:hypothetical protein